MNDEQRSSGPPLQAVQGATLSQDLRAALVDEIACGLVVTDAGGVVRFANRAGDDELRKARGLQRSGHLLRCTGAGARALEDALRGAALKNQRQIVLLGEGADRLMVSVMPLQPHGIETNLVLLMLGRRRPCSELGLEMLANAYRLTLAERRVMAALMDETAPREIAASHGVAISTVRTHISSIREKFGTRSIDGVLIRAAEVPPVSHALRHGGICGPTPAVHADIDRPRELPCAA